MSLDDQTPTEYFGPDAVEWDAPNGKTLRVHPNDARIKQWGGGTRPAEPLLIGGEVVEDVEPKPALTEESFRAQTTGTSDAFARAVSQRYNDSLWGWAPPSEEEQLEERRRLFRAQREQAKRDFTFALLMSLIQGVIAIVVTANNHHPAALAFCWGVAGTWALWAVYWGRRWWWLKRKCEGLK